MPADLRADTAVRADDHVPGRFHLVLPDHWDYMNPSGGVVMTCALRAAVAALAEPELRLASATTVFATPIRSGPLVADVHVIRRGKSATQLRVALKHAGPPEEPGLELIATFIRDRRGPDVKGVAFPMTVKSLADALPVDDDANNNPHNRLRFYHQIDCRIAEGERFWTPAMEAGPARYARWFRYKVPQRDGAIFDRLALPPLIDTMPTSLQRAIGPSPYRFFAPSLDLTTYMVDDTSREWLLVAVTMRRARVGWAIADAEVWDDEGRLVAYGSQAMYLHGLSGEPPTVDASRR
jgi:acyl-CoA thioesterase